MSAELTTISGHNGTEIGAYVAKPNGDGPFPGVLLIHHMPGWDEWYFEATRRFAHNGYLAISPDLYHREGDGASPEDAAAKARAAGGVSDEQAVGDLAAGARYLKALPESNGKVAVFGSCSGGRQAYLVATRTNDVDACLDLWGGGVVMGPDDLSEKRPVAPIDFTENLSVPLLGIFGNDDGAPTPEQVNQHEEELKRLGKQYDFHRYDGAGHGFFYYNRPAYRIEQALDGWSKIWAFLEQTIH
jgi:carboxymethylenebutenolidase